MVNEDIWLYRMGMIDTLYARGLNKNDINWIETYISLGHHTSPWYAPAGLKLGTLNIYSCSIKTGKTIFKNGR